MKLNRFIHTRRNTHNRKITEIRNYETMNILGKSFKWHSMVLHKIGVLILKNIWLILILKEIKNVSINLTILVYMLNTIYNVCKYCLWVNLSNIEEKYM